MKLQALLWMLLTGILALAPASRAEEPFTQKFQSPDGEAPPGGKDEGRSGKRGMGLTEEERERMKSIQEKLGREPDVAAAREAMKDAETPEERQAAMKNLKDAMDKHMSAEDRKFVDQVRKKMGSGKGGKGGEGRKKSGRQGPRGGGGGGSGFEGEGGQGGGPGQQGGGRPGVDGLFGPEGPDSGGGGPGRGEGFEGEGGQGKGDERRGRGGFQGSDRPTLTDEQRTRLKSIRDKYKNDPEVKAAREAVKDAVTPEERDLAVEEYRSTVQNKISAEDRSFLDELRKNRLQQRPTQIPGGERF